MSENRKIILNNLLGIIKVFVFFVSVISFVSAIVLTNYLGAIFWAALAMLLYKSSKDFVTKGTDYEE